MTGSVGTVTSSVVGGVVVPCSVAGSMVGSATSGRTVSEAGGSVLWLVLGESADGVVGVSEVANARENEMQKAMAMIAGFSALRCFLFSRSARCFFCADFLFNSYHRALSPSGIAGMF